jgi:hypothetical protein
MEISLHRQMANDDSVPLHVSPVPIIHFSGKLVENRVIVFLCR